MVSRLSLLDDTLSLLVGALVHAFHHILDLLQLQPLQVLVLVQGVCQQLLHTAEGRLQCQSHISDATQNTLHIQLVQTITESQPQVSLSCHFILILITFTIYNFLPVFYYFLHLYFSFISLAC